jgi:Glycosyl hydrolases family 31 TIM-barrel domain
MGPKWNRRDVLKGLAAASTAIVLPRDLPGSQRDEAIAAPQVEIRITSVSRHTIRLSILALDKNGIVQAIPFDGSLVEKSWGAPIAVLRGQFERTIAVDSLKLEVSAHPFRATLTGVDGKIVQRFAWDQNTGQFSFLIDNSPLFGLGEGGAQFDRRGTIDLMKSGQGGYQLATHGGRVPIPWIIGTSGWAMFFHQPYGTFDLTGTEGKLQPATAAAALPLDVFLVTSPEPAVIMSEYANITGRPEIPPLWSFGYQQSHRTLASREEILSEAKTFREKKLPCDTFIYLGTGFCPSGWNTENGSFVWNSRVFPDPKEMLDELHRENFHAVVHAVILSDKLRDTVNDPCDLSHFDESEASCYWDAHRKDFAMGIDGWWPDEGDPLDIASRLVRNRMYWEGPQIDRPNVRPYALHRNAYAGMQRYASFLWSGDVYSTWVLTSADLFQRQNLPPNSICVGFSMAPFAPCSAVTAAPGNSVSLGGGTPETPVRPKSTITEAPLSRIPASCTTLAWNPSAGNISNYGTACCRISTAPFANVRPPGCRSCAPCGCIIPTIRKPLRVPTHISSAKISWSRRSSKREQPAGRSTSRAASGMTTGQAKAWMADAKSYAQSIWKQFLSMCEADRSCHWGR